jgi:hypothetical protein
MKIKIFIIAAFFGFTLNAQSQWYNFSVSTGSYSDLNGSISLNNDVPWDDPAFIIPIGFNLQYFDTTMTQLFMHDYGLGGELFSSAGAVGISSMFSVYGADIIDRGYDVNSGIQTSGSLSNISYLLEGAAGARILKIEWNNVGFYSDLDMDGISTDFTNFQLWLYEGTNNIEIHVGPNSITQPNVSFDAQSGTYISLFPRINFDTGETLENGMELTGNPSNPDVLSVEEPFGNFLNGVIPNGTIYGFSHSGSAISENQNIAPDFSIFPNPVMNSFSITFEKAEHSITSISIVNTKGQIVKRMSGEPREIDISDLNAGIYFLKMNTKTGVKTRKLIKK